MKKLKHSIIDFMIDMGKIIGVIVAWTLLCLFFSNVILH